MRCLHARQHINSKSGLGRWRMLLPQKLDVSLIWSRRLLPALWHLFFAWVAEPVLICWSFAIRQKMLEKQRTLLLTSVDLHLGWRLIAAPRNHIFSFGPIYSFGVFLPIIKASTTAEVILLSSSGWKWLQQLVWKGHVVDPASFSCLEGKIKRE